MFLLLGVSMTPACTQNQEAQSRDASIQTKVVSSDTALKVATDYLGEQKADTTRHNMSRPEAIQEIEYHGKKAWRVSWKLKNFSGKGGQLVVIVYETGQCEQGWGE